MSAPEGTLTSTQLEIMEVVWNLGAAGVPATEIWQQISTRRKVVRTTILNQVDRLEKRGWLVRVKTDRGVLFSAAMDRDATENMLAQQFVNDYFKGSVSTLFSRLFGGSDVSEDELRKMQALMDTLPVRDETPLATSRSSDDVTGPLEQDSTRDSGKGPEDG